ATKCVCGEMKWHGTIAPIIGLRASRIRLASAGKSKLPSGGSYRMNVHADPTPRSDNKVSFRGGDMPIRSPFAHHGDLRRLGAALARGAHEHIEDIEPFEPRDRTKDNAERIRSVVHVLNRAQLDGESVTPAANWLFDNSHVIEQAI